jgi:hypothetical protein
MPDFRRISLIDKFAHPTDAALEKKYGGMRVQGQR